MLVHRSVHAAVVQVNLTCKCARGGKKKKISMAQILNTPYAQAMQSSESQPAAIPRPGADRGSTLSAGFLFYLQPGSKLGWQVAYSI